LFQFPRRKYPYFLESRTKTFPESCLGTLQTRGAPVTRPETPKHLHRPTEFAITVLLADDHTLVRKGFRRLLEDDPEIRVVSEAGDGLEAVKMATELRPRVAILDMSMPRLNGTQACLEILRTRPKTLVLILSMYSEENYVRSAFDAGARGYLLKNASDIDLAGAVRRLAAGRKVVSPGLLPAVAGPDTEAGQLSAREKQVLKLIAEGNSNKQIAALLDLSPNTVNVHRANIMETLGINGTAGLVLYAVRTGLVRLP